MTPEQAIVDVARRNGIALGNQFFDNNSLAGSPLGDSGRFSVLLRALRESNPNTNIDPVNPLIRESQRLQSQGAFVPPPPPPAATPSAASLLKATPDNPLNALGLTFTSGSPGEAIRALAKANGLPMPSFSREFLDSIKADAANGATAQDILSRMIVKSGIDKQLVRSGTPFPT